MGSSKVQPERRGYGLAEGSSFEEGSPRQTLKTNVGSSRTQPKRWKTTVKIKVAGTHLVGGSATSTAAHHITPSLPENIGEHGSTMGGNCNADTVLRTSRYSSTNKGS